ncbi:hypothetical protein I315_01901 [Cryptococcus gattii Ru294]|nr:hypothetical protein I315_01901 [Cryptococcus gattii Ru294]
MPKLIKGIHIRPSTKRKSYASNSSKYRRVRSDGCDPAAKRLRGNAAVLYELEERDRINRERESRLAAYAASLQQASQAAPSGSSFVQQSQNKSTSTVDGDNGAQNESECDDIDPGPWIPPRADEEMEAREDSWTQTINQFIWEQAQKGKPKEAQSQYRTAKVVWTNKWKNIRTDLFDTYLRYKRFSDEGDIFLGIEHLNKKCKCTSTKSRDVAFIDRDNHCYESVPFCKCTPDPVRLLARGFIAVSPDTPKTAISISVVQYFETIRESVPMSVSGFAKELWRCHTLRGEAHSSQITHRVRATLRSATRLMAPFASFVMEGLFFDKLYSSFAIYFYRMRNSTERRYPLILLKSSQQSVQPVLDSVSKRICKQVIATTFSPPTAISVT